MDIETVRSLIARFPRAQFSGGVEESTIDAASARLGVPVTGGYRIFLRTLGSGGVASEEFYGLGGPKHLDIVDTTEWLRRNRGPSEFPRHLIPLLDDGFGNYECLDTNRLTFADEAAVIIWFHDGGDDQELEQIGDTYLDWLAKTLRDLHEHIYG